MALVFLKLIVVWFMVGSVVSPFIGKGIAFGNCEHDR